MTKQKVPSAPGSTGDKKQDDEQALKAMAGFIKKHDPKLFEEMKLIVATETIKDILEGLLTLPVEAYEMVIAHSKSRGDIPTANAAGFTTNVLLEAKKKCSEYVTPAKAKEVIDFIGEDKLRKLFDGKDEADRLIEFANSQPKSGSVDSK